MIRDGVTLPRYRCLPDGPYAVFGQGCGAEFTHIDLRTMKPEPSECPVCGNEYLKWINAEDFCK